MSGLTPELADVIEAYVAAGRAEMHTSCPARVKSYDPTTKTVTVEPTVKRVSRNADNERIIDTLPVLPSVPVAWPRGGGFFLYLPLVAGDGGLLVFPDHDIGPWRQTGEVSDPGDERVHALGGAVFYPGLETVARTLAEGTTHLILGKEGGPAIHINGSSVELGAAGGDFVALAAAVATQLSALKSAISGAAVVAGDGGAAFKANIVAALSGWPSSVAATLTKAT